MKAIVQRIVQAQVEVEGRVVGQCGTGFLVLIAVHVSDTEAESTKLADRIWGMRILNDADGKMNLSLRQVVDKEKVGVLAISNFTVYGDTSSNRRPSFFESAPYERGKMLYDHFVDELRKLGCHVETGVYGADMTVSTVADGPVTVIVETRHQESHEKIN